VAAEIMRKPGHLNILKTLYNYCFVEINQKDEAIHQSDISKMVAALILLFCSDGEQNKVLSSTNLDEY
jgi:hypothetical protein